MRLLCVKLTGRLGMVGSAKRWRHGLHSVHQNSRREQGRIEADQGRSQIWPSGCKLQCDESASVTSSERALNLRSDDDRNLTGIRIDAVAQPPLGVECRSAQELVARSKRGERLLGRFER
jgi:hypothetical protein